MKANQKTRLTVTHPAGHYDVIIGHDLLRDLTELGAIKGAMAIITDNIVGSLYAAYCDPATTVITIPAGEEHKTLATVASIYPQLLEAGIDRSGTIIALGGGVVGDVAGFVAATYMRGVNFIQCPTTLLAMVDASVGGKTGVDLPQGKNLIGAFKQPAAVIVDLSTLETLPPVEFIAGMAEVVKHGLIAAPSLLRRSELSRQVPSSTLRSLVTEAIQVKLEIVQEDPFEQGRRAVLNLGHTFAHAIERVSGYSIRHGAAVAMGLAAAADLSARLEECSPELPNQLEMVLTNLGLPTRIPAELEPAALLRAMDTDKKKAKGKLRFVLLRNIGDVFVADEVPEMAVLETLAAMAAKS